MAHWLRPTTKPSWEQLRQRLVDTLPQAFPATSFLVAGHDQPPEVGWHDGPAERSVAGAVGEAPGWRFESAMVGPFSPDLGRSALSVLRLARSFSERAMAVAVVRFQASGPRPYSSRSKVARERLWSILETDNPADSGYPLVDAMAEMLLSSPDPEAPPEDLDEPADRLAWRLRALGYDRLWSRAWAETPL